MCRREDDRKQGGMGMYDTISTELLPEGESEKRIRELMDRLRAEDKEMSVSQLYGCRT